MLRHRGVAGSVAAGSTTGSEGAARGRSLTAGVSVTFISREPLEQAQHEIQQQQKAIKQLADANESLRRQVRALGGQIDELKKAMVVIVNEVDFHEHDLSDISDVETATLVPRVEQAAERLDELDFRCDESNGRLRELERQVHHLRAQLAALDPQLAFPEPELTAPGPSPLTTPEPPWPPPVAERDV